MITEDTLLRLSENAVATTIDGEAVILDMASGRYFGLEGVGAYVCELLQAPVTFARLVSLVVARYDVDRSTGAADLEALLEDMQRAGLIAVDGTAPV